MKEFAIFQVLDLYNTELKQKHSSHNSQNKIGSHTIFLHSCTLTKMRITLNSNHHNWIIVLVKKNNKDIYICFSGLMVMNLEFSLALEVDGFIGQCSPKFAS